MEEKLYELIGVLHEKLDRGQPAIKAANAYAYASRIWNDPTLTREQIQLIAAELLLKE